MSSKEKKHKDKQHKKDKKHKKDKERSKKRKHAEVDLTDGEAEPRPPKRPKVDKEAIEIEEASGEEPEPAAEASEDESGAQEAEEAASAAAEPKEAKKDKQSKKKDKKSKKKTFIEEIESGKKVSVEGYDEDSMDEDEGLGEDFEGVRKNADGMVLGKFQKVEDEKLWGKIKQVFKDQVWTMEKGLQKLQKGMPRKVWDRIVAMCPNRPRARVVQHCKRVFNNYDKGEFTDEDREKLNALVEKYGETNWTEIGRELNRNPWAVRDRWRNNKDPLHKHGPWTKEEEQKLVQCVLEANGGELPSKNDDIRWARIVERMAPRTARELTTVWARIEPRKQAMAWHYEVTKRETLVFKTNPWSEADTKSLILKLSFMQPLYIEDVNWHALSRTWRGDSLRQTWTHLIKRIGKSETMTMPEILRELRRIYKLNRPDRDRFMKDHNVANW